MLSQLSISSFDLPQPQASPNPSRGGERSGMEGSKVLHLFRLQAKSLPLGEI